MSVQEVEQDPFDPEEFVERLAWRTANANRPNPAAEPNFDPIVLEKAFKQMILDLQEEDGRIQKKATKLEQQVKNEEKDHWKTVGELQKKNLVAFQKFQDLDDRINYVATKVVHLGDQLESVNAPRARAVEAKKLMKFFSEFLENDIKSELFTDPENIFLGADLIQKLYQIAQDLPPSDQFNAAKARIEEMYSDIEKRLIQKFVGAFRMSNKKEMKRIANTLANFKGYSQCVNEFIEESQKNVQLKTDIFSDILVLCISTSELIGDVFNNPEDVMAKFVLNIYHGKLQDFIIKKLSDEQDREVYLENLHVMYTKTVKLSNQLSNKLNLGNDPQYLQKLTKNLFAKNLDSYIGTEIHFMRERCIEVLERYYDGKGHQKRKLETGGIVKEIRRDIQAKMNINIGATLPDNYGDETFLSQEVAINILQESKNAFKRCQALSSTMDVASNAVKIFDCLVQYLCTEHIEYAIEIALQAIPPPEPKFVPNLYFFSVSEQANTIFHLFEKQFCDSLMPLISSSPLQTDCIQKKKLIMEQMGQKLEGGLDRSIQTLTGWVKFLLVSEQKRTDFKPEDDDEMKMYSTACGKVVVFVEGSVKIIKHCLDGKNVEAVLTEFGIRFHRVIYEHLLQYQYNSLGAMLAICDVNEYRKLVSSFNVPLVTDLVSSLHSLCNLLVVVPENLTQVCTGEQLVGLDKNVLHNFVQLRADYKTEKLGNYFK